MNVRSPRQGTAVTMLLIGEPAYDYRVTKTARSLVEAGCTVTVVCIPLGSVTVPAEVGGAVVRRCTAYRPLRALGRVLKRKREHAKTAAVGPSPGSPSAAAVPSSPAKLLREVRVLGGTFWLNIALARDASAVPADVIHANDLDTLWAASWVARKQGARLIYDSHELYPDMLPGTSPLVRGILRLLEHRLIRKAHAVLTVNVALATELQRRHRLARMPTVVMNCPPLQPLPRVREGLGGAIGMVYLGALHAERGLEVVLQAMPSIDARVVLHVRGSGPLRSMIEARAQDPTLHGRIIVHDPVPAAQVGDTLEGMAIGLVPYVATSLNNYLCSPTKLFDYFMAGLAVVAADLPEIRRAVARYGAGELYDSADPEALAHAVNGLAADPECLQRRRVGAREAAEREFNWAGQEHALLTAYGEALP